MKFVLIRFLIVWLALNLIVLPIEWYRYKHSTLSITGFLSSKMCEFTAFVIAVDMAILGLSIVVSILCWVLNPI